jgi:hypothetical protein
VIIDKKNIQMIIKKNKKYRIKTKSEVFKNKYGNESPYIIIEDRDVVVFGDSWEKRKYVPAILAFMMRQSIDNIYNLQGNNKAYYGKIFTDDINFGIGELVFKSELEEMK